MSELSKKRFSVIFYAVFATGVALCLVWYARLSFPSDDSLSTPSTIDPEPPSQGEPLEAREKRMDETVWAKEMMAQSCGRTFEALWDSLNAATNKLHLLEAFPVGEILLGQWKLPQILPHGIQRFESAGPGPVLSAEQWRQWIEGFSRDGWRLEQTEFRHNRFDTGDNGEPRQSQFYFSAHLNHPGRAERAIVEGDLVVDWAAKPSSKEPVAVHRIDASRLTIKTRQGEPPFQTVLLETINPPEKSFYIDPLILYDLDGDGLSEIILAAKNRVYHRRGEDRYEAAPLCRHPPGLITAAVIADFDGDGSADFLCAKTEGLFLYKGSPRGAFDEPGRLVWPASSRLINTMVLTCGDIDHDGDLDVFLGQYRVPTLGQVLQPHYYDANDGHAAYLLLNDGQGNFTDATETAGLSQKRWRRSYSASLVDLDSDGHLDLAVVSDFAGLDLYKNDGGGRFTDATRQWAAEPHAFGMAHALADFNADGRLDLLMIGMPSPAVDRLEHLGLWRPDADEDRAMRSRMAYGNRLYLARPAGGFDQTPMNDSIARSGWSWGCGVFDLDNDGFPDVYIATGQESKQSVRDYEPEFWLHDIFVDHSIDDYSTTAYFMAKFARTRGQGWSYGGYEKNRLYLNQGGASFVEIGHLMGVALERDSRNVVADDLDGDGRMDLLVATVEAWPEVKQTLRVYKNTLKDFGQWIGFRFRDEGGGNSPVGARVAVHYGDRTAVRHIVTGDSHRSQHANTLHFGLGESGQVDRVEIRWLNGRTLTLQKPAVNCYHTVRAPAASSP